MSERDSGDVRAMIDLIVDPGKETADPDDMEDFREEFWQFSGGYKLPDELGLDQIRVAAAYMLTAYEGNVIDDSIDKILLKHLNAVKETL